MASFIKFPCFIKFNSDESCGYIPPVPPTPTPFDRIIPEPDGLDDYETEFETLVPGGIIIGICAKNNNLDTQVEIAVTIDDEPLFLTVQSQMYQKFRSYSCIAVLPDIAIGNHVIKIQTINGSSAGTAALRIIETDPMPEDWEGVQSSLSSNTTSPSFLLNMRNADIGSMILSAVCWDDATAYPPSAETYSSPIVQFDKVRDNLIYDELAVGFFRFINDRTGLYCEYKGANRSSGFSGVSLELKGVTLRP